MPTSHPGEIDLQARERSATPRLAARAVLLLAVCLAALAAPGPAAAQSPARMAGAGTWYVVRIAAWDRRLVNVEARIELTDSLLVMYPEGADHVPNGWATFVRELVATDDAGRRIRLRDLGKGRWSVPRPFPPAVRLRYEVLLHHDAGPWPFGAKEAAYVKDDGIFVTGRALFIAQEVMRPIAVRIEVPERWFVATPWAEAPGQRSIFRVPDATELLQVGMALGQHQQRRLLLGGTTVILAVGRALPGALELFAGTLGPALARAEALFGGSPAGKFVVIAHADNYDGGSAFIRSFDVVFREPPTQANRDQWGHVVTHEVLHLWLGGAISPPQRNQEYWLTEGTTDYLANLLQLRAGIVDRDAFLARIGEAWDRYVASDRARSLRAAGTDKAGNYDLLYSGGLLATLVLDVEMRRATDGRAGIDALMRRLYAQHGRTQRPMTYADLRQVVVAVATPAQGALLDRLTGRADPLPVAEALAALGLELVAPPTGADAARTAVRPRADATAEQRALLAQLLGG
jgi:predicted metalloprotease with PDZ domain